MIFQLKGKLIIIQYLRIKLNLDKTWLIYLSIYRWEPSVTAAESASNKIWKGVNCHLGRILRRGWLKVKSSTAWRRRIIKLWWRKKVRYSTVQILVKKIKKLEKFISKISEESWCWHLWIRKWVSVALSAQKVTALKSPYRICKLICLFSNTTSKTFFKIQKNSKVKPICIFLIFNGYSTH